MTEEKKTDPGAPNCADPNCLACRAKALIALAAEQEAASPPDPETNRTDAVLFNLMFATAVFAVNVRVSPTDFEAVATAAHEAARDAMTMVLIARMAEQVGTSQTPPGE